SDVDRRHTGTVDELAHGRDVAREQEARPRIGLIFRDRVDRVVRRVEIHFHLRRHAHAIELLLPVTLGNGVIDEHDEAQIQRLTPSNDDLPMNEPVVDPIQHECHAPAPYALIAARPRSAAWRAASGAGRPSAKTKSSSNGRFVPATRMASSMPRRIRRDAMVQLPACRSVKITFTPCSNIFERKSSSMSCTLSFATDTGMSCVPRPVICSTADTRPAANSP